MPIRTLLFDLSEVFISGLYGLKKTLAPLLNQEERAILKALGGEGLHMICCGQWSEDEYLSALLQHHGWGLTAPEIKRLIRENMATEMPGMRALLERLDYPGRPYRLALLSDHGAEWITHARTAHTLFDHFDRLFFSYELGQTKGDPATFQRVLDLLDSPAGEMLFVDDNKANVARAQSVGIQGIVFTGADALEMELVERGILGGGTSPG